MPYHAITALRLKFKSKVVDYVLDDEWSIIVLFSTFRFQLAGVVAVEVTGGPTIDFVPGRKVCYSGLSFPTKLVSCLV